MCEKHYITPCPFILIVKPLKPVKTIKDPKAFELLADGTRRNIIYLLRVKEMTVSQIASEMELTAQAIYHHIRKMKAAGMVDVAREERVGHYRSSAETFLFLHGEAGKKQTTEEMTRASFEGLVKLGLVKSVPDKEMIAKIAKLITKVDSCCHKGDLADKIGEMPDVGYFVRQMMTEYASFLMENEDQFEERVKVQRELGSLLRSLPRPVQKAKSKKK
jgi:DNA-binding transcriptional ArsR family regulator